MTEKEGFIDSLKHMVFEDEPASATPTPAQHSSGAAATQQSAATAPAFVAASVGDNDEVYRRLLSKTDFASTTIGGTIQKFLAPLDGLPMDASLKFKTAVAQAKAQNGLSDADILAAFEQMSTALRQEEEAFNGKARQFAAREISGRQERMNQITAQITQLQQELSQLSPQLVDAQAKAARAQGQFTAAIQRRAVEIEQQKAQYSALLK